MKVLIGLGNPGGHYKHTRHNIGFSVIDAISKDKGILAKKKNFRSLIGKGKIFSQGVLLVKPQTYMNLTGEAIRALVLKNKLDLSDLLVICDDVNLPSGFIRLRTSGSYGGHKGLKSINESLKTKEYPRLRIGIGKDIKNRNEALSSYVLKPIDKKTKDILKKSIELAKDAC